MRIFVAGATGAVGRRLVPLLVANGHEVIGTTRSAAKAAELRAAGAQPAVVDVLDPAAVEQAVRAARPDVIVHQATALAGVTNLRKLDAEFELTNRLRTAGTDNLLAAARRAGVRRLVAQSFTGWPYARVGGPVKSEDDPLDPDPPRPARRTHAAIRYLETAVTSAASAASADGGDGGDGPAGLVLRYGGFYGPGTSLSADGSVIAMIRKRRFPIVGKGSGIWSFIHIDDVASATAIAVERGDPGVYNVVDDEPAPVSTWLPHLAAIAGAKPPLRVPTWVGRLAIGELGVAMMTDTRGASNAKAKRELGWRLAYPSWRDGFRAALEETSYTGGATRGG
jgi:nucleoside-diphosphate-sugar epimerase